AQVLDVELSKVLELEPDGKTMLLRAGVGWQEGLVGRARVASGALSQAGFTLLSAGPVVVTDMGTETRFQGPSILLDHGVVSGLSVTICQGDRSYGVLGAHTSKRRTFTTDDINFLQSVANILAAALMRRDVEKDLRESEARFRAILNHAPVAIYMVDPEGSFLLVNRHVEALLGRPVAQIIGKNILDLLPRPHAEKILESYRTVLRTAQLQELIEEAPFPDGVRTFISLKFPMYDAAGNICAVCSISTDITERIKLEEQLRQTQKMEAIGKLAGGIAHDFNNLLTVINGYSEMAMANLPTTHPCWRQVREIYKSGDRAASLTRQLLAFSRKTILQPRVLDLNALMADTEKMLRRLIGEDILLSIKPAPGLGRVKADPGQLEQVIMNLAINARDAMPLGGRLILETKNAEPDEDFARINPVGEPGPYVLLSVTDTGCGMTDQVLAHIFEPFFTTKSVGEGTGLGLAMVYGIIKQSGGHIAVDTEVGEGSTFRIYLPRLQEAVRAEQSSSEISLPQSGTETVLLVEDEDAVRRLAQLGLKNSGYTVLEARDGAEALELAAGHPGRIDLLITDVVMPGMSGPLMAEQLRAARPNLKVL
ncbi:MAG: hypothetical protein A3G75_13060, partial [Verrucomicrobia bacterium RIFCSPLOWO2_12_FULL_64_8]